MRKEMKSKSKRKWILGGIAAFSSIALLTTGFSVWVVGSTKKNDTGNVNVTVDTAKNNSISFKITSADSAIKLEEQTAVSNGKVINTQDITTTDTNPLAFNFSATIKWGSDYTIDFDTIHFEIDSEKTGDDYATLTTEEGANKIGTVYRAEKSSWNYINVPEDITVDTSSVSPENGMTTLTITQSIAFTWGDFFDNKSPVTYYNNFATEKSLDEDKCLELGGNAVEELKAMKTHFLKKDSDKDFKTIALKASLIKKETTQNS